MKIINTTFLTFLICASSFSASAADLSFKSIKPLVLKYADSIGCANDTLDPKLVTKFSDKSNGIENAFLAVVYTDQDCMGGSGTGAGALIFLQIADGREGIEDPTYAYLKISPALSQPIAMSNAPTRTLTSLYQKGGQLFATGLEYAANDSNCCPSLKTIYKITLLKKIVAISKDDSRTFYSWDFVKVKSY